MSLPILNEFVKEYYLALKSFHIISMTAWMAGLFYLPRLFVYHHEAPKDSVMAKTFETMEEKLYKIIVHPAAWLTTLSGLFLALGFGFFKFGWMHLKFTGVLALWAFQFLLNSYKKEFKVGTYPKTPKFFRALNEIPTLLLIVIVISVVFKPF
jgi:putative membrane protein